MLQFSFPRDRVYAARERGRYDHHVDRMSDFENNGALGTIGSRSHIAILQPSPRDVLIQCDVHRTQRKVRRAVIDTGAPRGYLSAY